jgi:hypothetical protein
LILLAAAAAGPLWNHPRPGTIAVMVDLSPSTRGADFRKPDFVRQRLAELIGNASSQLIGFAAANRPLDPAGPFEEIAVDQTVFSPADADAIILFSDARFDLPAKSPRIYIAVDSGLEDVSDASVQRLERFGSALSATIANTGAPRQATLPGSSMPIGDGTFLVTCPIPSTGAIAKVELNPGDLWPENDSLSLRISPPWMSEKWWVGGNPPPNWRFFSPAQLPDLPEEYLAPAMIVIDNQSADRFSPAGLDRLTQYVRDLGGSVLHDSRTNVPPRQLAAPGDGAVAFAGRWQRLDVERCRQRHFALAGRDWGNDSSSPGIAPVRFGSNRPILRHGEMVASSPDRRSRRQSVVASARCFSSRAN